MLVVGIRDGEYMERMLGITEEDMKRYRLLVGNLYDSDQKLYDAIYSIDCVMRAILDKEFGNCAVQLARNSYKDLDSQRDSRRANFDSIGNSSEEA